MNAMNKKGNENVPVTYAGFCVEFEAAEETAALILILEKRTFAKGFIPQSIGIDGDFAPGALIANETTHFNCL
jgi:hypothetical protein